MYVLVEFDYTTKDNKVISAGSLYDTLNELENEAHNYILEKQGDNIHIDYYDFIYNYDEEPNRQRALEFGAFYVKKSKYDVNKFTIREKKKIYGIFYNTYETINHKSYTLVKGDDIKHNPFYNNEFDKEIDYQFVLCEFMKLNKELYNLLSEEYQLYKNVIDINIKHHIIKNYLGEITIDNFNIPLVPIVNYYEELVNDNETKELSKSAPINIKYD